MGYMLSLPPFTTRPVFDLQLFSQLVYEIPVKMICAHSQSLDILSNKSIRVLDKNSLDVFLEKVQSLEIEQTARPNEPIRALQHPTFVAVFM